MAKTKPTEDQAVVDAQASEPAPVIVAKFRYLPNARVPARYDSGVDVVLEFDADGMLYCDNFALRNAAWRATVDPDLPPGHISQVVD